MRHLVALLHLLTPPARHLSVAALALGRWLRGNGHFVMGITE
jgi:hypothetical protein